MPNSVGSSTIVVLRLRNHYFLIGMKKGHMPFRHSVGNIRLTPEEKRYCKILLKIVVFAYGYLIMRIKVLPWDGTRFLAEMLKPEIEELLV